MSQLCLSLENVHFHEFKYTIFMWQAQMNRDGGKSFCEKLGAEGPPRNPFFELLLWCLGFKRHTLPGIGLGCVEKYKDPHASEYLEMLNMLREKMEKMMGDNGVFLYPTFPVPPQYHREPVVTIPNFSYTCLFNALGFPVCHVPLGLSAKEGVPIGIQVVAGMYQDRLALAVTNELARAFGGWVSPSIVQVD